MRWMIRIGMDDVKRGIAFCLLSVDQGEVPNSVAVQLGLMEFYAD